MPTIVGTGGERVKFTWETDTQQITFLDVDIYIQHREGNSPRLANKTHFKKTNSFQYIHHSSYHPRATKRGIIKGEMTRLTNTTSDPQQRENTLDFIAGKFKERNYPTQTSQTLRTALPHPLRSNSQASSRSPM